MPTTNATAVSATGVPMVWKCATPAPTRNVMPAPANRLRFWKITTSRQGGAITYEGDLKVAGEKPVAGLILHVELLDTEGVLLTIQKIETAEDTLAPGVEKHFAVQGNDVPRAVSFRLSATDRTGRDLSTAGSGPYPLD